MKIKIRPRGAIVESENGQYRPKRSTLTRNDGEREIAAHERLWVRRSGGITASQTIPIGEDWVRLPKPKGRFLGLSRTSLLELCDSGAIKSVSLRKRHALRGIRLLYLPSLLAYLNKNATGGCEASGL